MPNFTITLTQIAEDEDLDFDDRMEFGECGSGGKAYETEMFNVDDEEAALDVFHASVPIACLENYEWEVSEIPTECTQETLP